MVAPKKSHETDLGEKLFNVEVVVEGEVEHKTEQHDDLAVEIVLRQRLRRRIAGRVDRPPQPRHDLARHQAPVVRRQGQNGVSHHLGRARS